MPSHRFAVGEIACFRSRSPVKLPGSFDITALMPQRGGIPHYRIESEYEQHERVVKKDDIEPLFDNRPANNSTPAHLRG